MKIARKSYLISLRSKASEPFNMRKPNTRSGTQELNSSALFRAAHRGQPALMPCNAPVRVPAPAHLANSNTVQCEYLVVKTTKHTFHLVIAPFSKAQLCAVIGQYRE